MMNREAWLDAAATVILRRRFEAAGYELPEVRVSTGFPGGGSKRTRIGECWTGKAAEDGLCQIFISPILKGDIDVVATLAHELVHAAVGVEAGHKSPFKRCALAIGLEGRMTSTHAGEALRRWIEDEVVYAIGHYPGGVKQQTTRMVKCQCDACGYIARTTRHWLERAGAPLCACNGEPMEVLP